MPVFEYRCECGKRMDILVRNGREPATCSDADEASDWCRRGGRLTRQVSAPYVGSAAGSWGFRTDTGEAVRTGGETCGHCGGIPGSCQSDN